MSETGSRAILSSIASCLSSRLEIPAEQAIDVRVRVVDPAGRVGLAEAEVGGLVRARLEEAGIRTAAGEGGCTLHVAAEIDADGLCTVTLEFFRLPDIPERPAMRHARRGAWSLTHMARADSAGTVRIQLSWLAGEFIRQYMEAN